MGKYECEIDLSNFDDTHSLMLQEIKKNTVVLEFGPASGFMTRYMKEELNCRVYIVEYNQEDYEQAVKYAEGGVLGDLEDGLWLEKFKGIAFDYIIFGDVLEHLSQPAQALKRSLQLLRDKGEIIISVPNIAHNSIILELLNDRFVYHGTGLLDNTHIHFFTYRTLHKMLDECGLSVIKEQARFIEESQTEFKSSWAECTKEVRDFLQARKLGRAYQFVFKAVKKEYFREAAAETDSMAVPLAVSGGNGKLYFDRGNGFSEADCLMLPITAERGLVEYELLLDGSEKRLRFDPAEQEGCLVSEIELRLNDRKLDIYESNGLRMGRSLIFGLPDPQVVYQLPDRIKNARVTLKAVYQPAEKFAELYAAALKGEQRIEQLCREVSAKAEELQRALKAKDDELQRVLKVKDDERERAVNAREEKIVCLEKNLAYLKQFNEAILNSRSWKMTAIFRNIARKLRRQE